MKHRVLSAGTFAFHIVANKYEPKNINDKRKGEQTNKDYGTYFPTFIALVETIPLSADLFYQRPF